MTFHLAKYLFKNKNSDTKTTFMDVILLSLLTDFEQAFTQWFASQLTAPSNKYLLKESNRNTGKRCEICYTSTITTPERRQ